jgi:hypothetical protein
MNAVRNVILGLLIVVLGFFLLVWLSLTFVSSHNEKPVPAKVSQTK